MAFTTPYTARARPDDGSTVRIADLIAQAGRDAAQIQLRRGDIAAQGAQNLGSIAGNGLMSIAKFAQEGPQRAQEAQLRDLSIQEGKGRVAAEGRKVADQSAYDAILRTAGDRESAIASAKTVAPHLIPALTEFFDNQAESASKLAKSKADLQAAQEKADADHLDYVGGLMADVAKHNYDPSVFSAAVSHAFLHGSLDKQTAGQLIASAMQQPESIKAMAEAGIAASPSRQKAAAAQTAELEKPVKVTEGEKIVIPATGKIIAEGNPKDPSLQSENNWLLDGKATPILFNPKTGARSLTAGGPDVSARLKPTPSAAQVQINAGSGLDAAALDQAAQKYLDGGPLPTGMGAAGIARSNAVMNRAAQLDPTAALARNAATLKADTANLTNLQRTEGTLSAFESTAGKNLDQFLSLAEKIPDTGVPWLNTPVRLLTQSAVGSANMAAINAARDVALREIARVTNDPKLSGALTDSARAEIQSLNPRNATLLQIKAVARVLKQDMANVHAGLNKQIADVKAGIGSSPATQTGTPKVIRYDMNGKVIP